MASPPPPPYVAPPPELSHRLRLRPLLATAARLRSRQPAAQPGVRRLRRWPRWPRACLWRSDPAQAHAREEGPPPTALDAMLLISGGEAGKTGGGGVGPPPRGGVRLGDLRLGDPAWGAPPRGGVRLGTSAWGAPPPGLAAPSKAPSPKSSVTMVEVSGKKDEKRPLPQRRTERRQPTFPRAGDQRQTWGLADVLLQRKDW